MTIQQDSFIIFISLLAMIGAIWQAKSASKQIKILISEREKRDAEIREEQHARLSILFDRYEMLSKQLEKMERQFDKTIAEIFSRLNK